MLRTQKECSDDVLHKDLNFFFKLIRLESKALIMRQFRNCSVNILKVTIETSSHNNGGSCKKKILTFE